VAADSLRSSKLRTFLTLLGIILATTTLIAVMSMIHGMDVYIASTVSNMGSDGFRVVKIAFLGNFDPKKYLLMQKRNPEPSLEEYQYLKEHATLVSDFGMGASRSVSVSLGSQTLTDVTLEGGTDNWATLTDTQIANGRYFSEIENRRRAAVAVIGADIRNNLFGGSDPLGHGIKVEGLPFTVIGVAEAKAASSANPRMPSSTFPSELTFRFTDRGRASVTPAAPSAKTCWSRPRTKSGC